MKRKPKPTPEQLELIDLQARWLAADGFEMPLNIQIHDLGFIRRAVALREQGETVFVPTEPVEVTGGDSETIREWDNVSNG